jgi:hypothetical protein
MYSTVWSLWIFRCRGRGDAVRTKTSGYYIGTVIKPTAVAAAQQSSATALYLKDQLAAAGNSYSDVMALQSLQTNGHIALPLTFSFPYYGEQLMSANDKLRQHLAIL